IVIWRGTDGVARRTGRSMSGESVTTAWSPTRAVEPADGHVAQRHVRRTAAVGLRVQDTSGLPALLIALASRLGGYPEALAVMPSGEAERARVTATLRVPEPRDRGTGRAARDRRPGRIRTS